MSLLTFTTPMNLLENTVILSQLEDLESSYIHLFQELHNIFVSRLH